MSQAENTRKQDVLAAIGEGPGSGARRWITRGVVLLVIAGLVGALVMWRKGKSRTKVVGYVATPAVVADLRATVTATGSVKALDQVDVGVEVSGTVKVVHVDFNDEVKAGQVLCELDSSRETSAVAQGRAQLRARQAEVGSAKANAEEARQTSERTKGLFARGLASQKTLEAAAGSLARANAALTSAKAQVTLARATLGSSEITLSKTTIRSPIDGVVLSRTVEAGQTVAASFATPVVFTIARDLTKMEVEVDVDEADIGQVAVGQDASFTVDAFPGRNFPAKLTSIRNTSTIVNNVVTYRSVLEVGNDDLVLRPGMTATVSIVTAERNDALLIPNSALRFTPPSEIKKSAGGPNMGALFGGKDKKGNREGQMEAEKAAKAAAEKAAAGPTIWLLRESKPVPVQVTVGLDDGTMTEVVGGPLAAGDQVITDITGNGG